MVTHLRFASHATCVLDREKEEKRKRGKEEKRKRKKEKKIKEKKRKREK